MAISTREPIVLASASPRRLELLLQWGVDIEVDRADVEELDDPGAEPGQLTRANAVAKLECVLSRHPDRIVLAADTAVAMPGEVLGKPRDAADARRMLRALSGRWHEVVSAVAVSSSGAGHEVDVARTRVRFRQISQDELLGYLESGEWRDKAGAYAIQGRAREFAEEIDGEVETVIGLPRELTLRMLERSMVEIGERSEEVR